jgi:lysyl-tRNA synthetase class 2
MKQHSQSWRPSAAIETLKLRAELNKKIRAFFEARQVLEVETPILSKTATVDPAIESFSTHLLNQTYYLQTSPEFFLKRLLAANAGDVFSLAKAFRQGEVGYKHQPEFTLLEWYRINWDEHQLIDEVIELLSLFFTNLKPKKITYRNLFVDKVGLDPFVSSAEEVEQKARKYIKIDTQENDKDFWLDLLMTHVVEPQLNDELFAVYNYPASQAALAKIEIDNNGHKIARRFEIYFRGMELANGYFELLDPVEQKKRFEKDLVYREKNNLPLLPFDEHLIAAMEYGLPACAGVAMGVDRLMMLLAKEKKIQNVLSFGVE